MLEKLPLEFKVSIPESLVDSQQNQNQPDWLQNGIQVLLDNEHARLGNIDYHYNHMKYFFGSMEAYKIAPLWILMHATGLQNLSSISDLCTVSSSVAMLDQKKGVFNIIHQAMVKKSNDKDKKQEEYIGHLNPNYRGPEKEKGRISYRIDANNFGMKLSVPLSKCPDAPSDTAVGTASDAGTKAGIDLSAVISNHQELAQALFLMDESQLTQLLQNPEKQIKIRFPGYATEYYVPICFGTSRAYSTDHSTIYIDFENIRARTRGFQYVTDDKSRKLWEQLNKPATMHCA